MPYNTPVVNQTTMYLSCPVTFDLQDAEWFDNLQSAIDDAMDWSVQLSGENVIVYKAIDGPYGYDFQPLKSIYA
jgi:hypothetical protein